MEGGDFGLYGHEVKADGVIVDVSRYAESRHESGVEVEFTFLERVERNIKHRRI